MAMNIYPSDLFSLLEFDKLLDLISERAVGDKGKSMILQILPEYNFESIQKKLLHVNEYTTAKNNDQQINVLKYYDTDEDIQLLKIEDFVLSAEGLKKIMSNILAFRNIFNFFKKKRNAVLDYSELYSLIKDIDFDEALLSLLQELVDDNGIVRNDATPELRKITQLQNSKRLELDKKFKQVTLHYLKLGYLKDNRESFRNGRRVLAVFAEKKRQVRGIIHDESSTGKTTFIEPEELIDINNDIFDLKVEYDKEIYKILKRISAYLRPQCSLLNTYLEILVEFDVIQAKSSFADVINAEMPSLKDYPHFKLKEARHPLLDLKLKSEGGEIVPFDLEFKHQNRILILSGPNAGGKSVCMKAVGLIQLMVQSGMLIPVHQDSEVGIFSQLFVDIGDQQSLDDDLSTYSYRLKNAAHFLENSNEKTLLLIDEFGSGTDPKIGGAIAEAVLHDLNKKKIFSIVTTHYSNLKIFAFNQKGIINGAMVFDRENLKPTYKMRIGKPGSSYAFEIAEKSGIHNRVIKNAKKNAGKNLKNMDELIVELQREKQLLEIKNDELNKKQKKLDQLINNYESAFSDMEFARKKLKLQIKEQSFVDTENNQKEIQKLIKVLKKEIDKEKALQKAQIELEKIKEGKEKIIEGVESAKEEIFEDFVKPKNKKIEVGAYVKLRDSGTIGEVKEIKDKNVTVAINNFTVQVKIRDLEVIDTPLNINSKKSIKTDMLERRSKFETKLDIRGMRYEDALDSVEKFLDQALVESINEVSIVHGKGVGVLRKLVWNKLKEYNSIDEYYHPPAEYGGNGITIINIY